MFQFMFMVQLLVKFRFFIQELWERKSLQMLYECWRRAYHVLLAQLFIYNGIVRTTFDIYISISANQHKVFISPLHFLLWKTY